MLQEFKAENRVDENDNPAGGFVEGVGLRIDWQNDPLGRNGDRKEPNGAFVETVIASVKQRLEHYQGSKFNCYENGQAILALDKALAYLGNRTKRREAQGTEGTHVEDVKALI